jgi:tetratricopeptide (TPR) repeat protein
MSTFAKYLLLGILFLSFNLPSGAQMTVSTEPQSVIAVFEAMYRYDFIDAEKKLRELNATNIPQDQIDLAHVNLLWWWLISGDESRDYENLMAAILNRIINRIDTKPSSQMTDQEVFTLVHSFAYLTRVDIFREKYLKGIVNLRHTLKFLEISLRDAERYDKFLMISGLYNFFAAAAQKEYPLFTPFFALGPSFNRDKGFSELLRCSRMDNLLIRNESLYYLMKIDYQLEKKYDDALRLADELIVKYPFNLIYHFHRFMILIEADRKPEALEQYSKMMVVALNAPGLNPLQKAHLIDIAKKRLRKEKINPAI